MMQTSSTISWFRQLASDAPRTLCGVAAAVILATPTLSAQRPLVLSRGGRTLVIERVELSVAGAQLLDDGQTVGAPGEPQRIRVDLRRNTAKLLVNGRPGAFRRIAFDLAPQNGWSVRITGRSDTTRFDIRVPLERRVATDLLIPRRLKNREPLEVRIRLQASRWFRDFKSGALLDPAADKETIVERVEASLPAANPSAQSEQSPSG